MGQCKKWPDGLWDLKLREESQIERARLLAENSLPMVAELYRMHADICEATSAPTQGRLKELKPEPAG